MTLTNPVQPRALSEEGLGRMRRALFRSSPIQRQNPKLRCQELLSVFITQDFRVMAQNTSHEPRNSIGKVFSQDPCEMSGCLKDLFVVSLWMQISSQDLETISFQKPIDLLDKTFQWDGQPPQRPSSEDAPTPAASRSHQPTEHLPHPHW